MKHTTKTFIEFQWATWCYIPQERTRQRMSSQVSKHILKCKIKLPSFCTCSPSKKNFTRNLPFATGHASQFSKQIPYIIHNQYGLFAPG
jgi:hypothetical protein